MHQVSQGHVLVVGDGEVEVNAYTAFGFFMIGLSVFWFGAYVGSNLERKRWRTWLRRNVKI